VEAESAAQIPEHELVEQMFADLQCFQHVAVPPQTPWPFVHRLRVEFRDLLGSGAPAGDVDALIVPQSVSAQARAVEFKRVLIPARAFATRQPNKLQELAKAVSQANRLAEIGFAHPWLAVLVVADTREITRGVGFLGPDRELMNLVREAIPMRELHPRVGLVINELTQCFDRPLGLAGMQGGNLIRLPQTAAQPEKLTASITALVAV